MNNIKLAKGFIAGIVAFLIAKLGLLYIVLPILLLAMIFDFCTGMVASKKEGNISSKTGMWGILKKLMYGVEVLVGVIVDWLILNVTEAIGIEVPTVTFFGLLVAVWLIINELISILENLSRLEIPMAPFLIKIVSGFKVVVEKSGENMAEKTDSKEERK